MKELQIQPIVQFIDKYQTSTEKLCITKPFFFLDMSILLMSFGGKGSHLTQ